MRRALVAVLVLAACSAQEPSKVVAIHTPQMTRARVSAALRALPTAKLRDDGFARKNERVASIGEVTPDDAVRSLSVDAPGYADDPISFALTAKGGKGTTMAMTAIGSRHARWELEGGTLVAGDVFPSVDALWSADVDRSELYYVLRDSQAPRTFRFALDAAHVEVETEGTIAIKEGERVAMRIPRPFAIDAHGVRREAGMRLERDQLIVDLDATDLAYPIVLDPGVETTTWTTIGVGSDLWARGTYAAGEVGGKLVVFGGAATPYTYPSTYLGDTWELSGTTWTKKLPATSPEPRASAFGPMPELGGKLYLVGGSGPTGMYKDMWRWDGVNWTKLSIPASLPLYRASQGLAASGSDIILFGGVDMPTSTYYNDTWVFDGSSWSSYAGAAPSPRGVNGLAKIAGGLALCGGYNGSPIYDTWMWNGGWTKKVDPAPTVTCFSDGARAYSLGTSWVYDGGTSWTSVPGTPSGPNPGSDVSTANYVTGETATWVIGHPKGYGWWSVQKLSAGTFTTVLDLSLVPFGAILNNAASLAIVGSGMWTRSGTTWSNTPWPFQATVAMESGGKDYAFSCPMLTRVDSPTTPTTVTSGFTCPSSTARAADSLVVTPTGEAFFNGQRYASGTVSNVGAHGPMALFKGEVVALEPTGALWKWSGSSWSAVTATGSPAATERVAAVGNRLIALGKSGANYDQLAIWNGTSWRAIKTTGGPNKVLSFAAAGSKFYAYWDSAETTYSGGASQATASLWSLDIGYDNGTACTVATDCTSGFCTDGVCCDVATCGAGSSCSTATTKGSCRKIDGQTCAAPAECGSGFCAGGTCCKTDCATTTNTCAAPGKAGTCLKLNGQPAASGSECASGIVADGVCCTTACTGKCVSCKAVDTGVAEGTCAPIVDGKDPASECPDPVDPNSCGPDGFCDGAGACRVFAPITKVCGAATCASGVVDGHHCNASGACIVGTTECKGFACADATNCLTSCTTSANCMSPNVCVGGACVTPLANGKACSTGAECASANCVDGVCCNNACDGQCQSCNVAGSEGSCSAVKGDPVGGRPACNGAGTPCAGSCDGVAAGCSYPSITTDCGSSCSDGAYVEKKCDNKGSCAVKDPVSCNNYACSTIGCKDHCTTAADCASADFDCEMGKCLPKSAPRCADDGVHILEGDKVTADCTPRRCAGGKCIETCIRSDSDCAPGYLCSEGTCVPRPDAPQDSDCGCQQPGHAKGGNDALWAALGVAVLGIIGRRARLHGRRGVVRR